MEMQTPFHVLRQTLFDAEEGGRCNGLINYQELVDTSRIYYGLKFSNLVVCGCSAG